MTIGGSFIKKGYLAIGGVGLYSVSVVAGYHAYKLYQQEAPPALIADPTFQRQRLAEVRSKGIAPISSTDHLNDNNITSLSASLGNKNAFDQLAETYDKDIGWEEFVLRLVPKRKFLARQAQGSVLEVSCGTGRNLEFFDPSKVSQLVMLDSSREMLQRAWDKWWIDEKSGAKRPADSTRIHPLFQVGSSENIPYPDGNFDVVLDTFGLCSCSDPSLALKEMARVTKSDGKLLFLEHGRSLKWSWLDLILDKTAQNHASDWGCWYNRDILDLFESSGLEIESCRRYHLGTTYVIIAKPASNPPNTTLDNPPVSG